MKITINKTFQKIDLKFDFEALFRKKFKDRVDINLYIDKSTNETTGCTMKFQFSREGKPEMVPVSGPSESSHLKIRLEFEPKEGVDVDKLGADIQKFMRNELKFNANDYEATLSQAPRFTPR